MTTNPSTNSAREEARRLLQAAIAASEDAARSLLHAADVASDNNQPETSIRLRSLALSQSQAADAARADLSWI